MCMTSVYLSLKLSVRAFSYTFSNISAIYKCYWHLFDTIAFETEIENIYISFTEIIKKYFFTSLST